MADNNPSPGALTDEQLQNFLESSMVLGNDGQYYRDAIWLARELIARRQVQPHVSVVVTAEGRRLS